MRKRYAGVEAMWQKGLSTSRTRSSCTSPTPIDVIAFSGRRSGLLLSTCHDRTGWTRCSPEIGATRFTVCKNGPAHALALRVLRAGQPIFVGIQMGQNES